VTVMGLGRFGGGVGVTRWLAGQAATVTVSDRAPAEELSESVAALAGLDVTLHLCGHVESDFTGCDVLVVNPAVPFDSPLIAAALAAGAELTTEINLFLRRCRCPVVAVTGTAGKSTTTAMIGAILGRARPTHVGGNIGRSLLEDLPDIAPDHVVVLELSSFQLFYLPLVETGPHVAVVTNLAPNHLDRHGTFEHYAASKKNILRYQGPDDAAVLNRDDPVAEWAPEARGRVVLFGGDDEPFALSVPGEHNQANAQAAWSAARLLGVARGAAAEALAAFEALPHRLQLVARCGGVRYYNDSKSTTPEGALAALASFPDRSAVIIVGGYDKGACLARLCAALAEHAKAVVAVGQTGPAIAEGIEKHPPGRTAPVILEKDFADAVAAARRLAGPGDVVLLSPGCASYDQFANYEQRGDAFTRLVRS